MPVFEGTQYTHEVVVARARVAYAKDLDEAKVVARAVSRAVKDTVLIYPAHSALPHSSYWAGRVVR